MNDLPLNALKKIVEKAVRPVQASTLCKQTMREEMLAHLIAVFEEEAKRGDERAPLDRTAERFGQSDELTRNLQESIPASDALHCLWEALWPRLGESVGRRVRRYCGFYSLTLMVFLPAWYVWLLSSKWVAQVTHWPVEEARLLGGPILILDVFFFALFASVLSWILVSGGRRMAARFRSQQEWDNLQAE